MTATKESTPIAWLKVTWPEIFGGPEAGGVSRQYETNWYKPDSEAPCDKPPLYEGHGVGWCGVVRLLHVSAIAAATAPSSPGMRPRPHRLLRASHRGGREGV